ncbi:mgpp2cl-1, protein phosphatase 2C-like protein 1 [Microsporum canis]|uniref:Protein phosphatase 2C ABI1 n=1 Tax=Arthroderma otae (strain ATCC MYA-4605 / CBS 113480) TaxID=554155 RepID=C5FMN1_ARTOC|nr:protein phosphatase 2C ABI1 [Microsporum canis CBS 113480]EEQ31134.1 protein phosphatase 2C ABI1 [Microsporum canis CBS 113480]
MFGGFSSPNKEKKADSSLAAVAASSPPTIHTTPPDDNTSSSREKRHFSLTDSSKRACERWNQPGDKKRRNSSVTKAAALFTSAKNSLHLSSTKSPPKEAQQQSQIAQTPLQILGKMDPALIVPQGSLNNSAGESMPTSRSSFQVGVTEDRNRKCRRTMEDTHAYLYNFLGAPLSPTKQQSEDAAQNDGGSNNDTASEVVETDNGYFAIFDGHAGSFAAEWCGKKLHLILEDTIRKNPSAPVPMLLDQTFTSVDQQLEQLPLKNSGCTAVIAVLRWEDRLPSPPASIAESTKKGNADDPEGGSIEGSKQSLSEDASAISPPEDHPIRSRVLYTANVGDARIILCRNGKALRLSYDHKGSDENEGLRITNAGGLILNNRVNGVLAVTRALGDTYMKDLVTGHPFTTETIIQPETDEFLILACDGLWDVCSDQEAVDLVRNTKDPQVASKILVDYALSRFSTDNLSCMIVRFDTKATAEEASRQTSTKEPNLTPGNSKKMMSEADKIVEMARKNAAEAENNNNENKVNTDGEEQATIENSASDNNQQKPASENNNKTNSE